MRWLRLHATITHAQNNVTTYGYDTESNLTSIQDANLHTTNFSYDAFGRVTKTTFPSTYAENYAYDAVGNLTSKTDRNNHTVTYTYDQLNRLAQKTYPDTTTVNYTYDNDSRLTQVTDPTGTYAFTFDNMGRLTNTTTNYAFLTGRHFNTAYGYDAASNRTSFTDPENGATAYLYDTLNRLQTLTPPAAFGGGNFGFGYDVLSRRTSLTRPNAVNTTYGYDTWSRLLSVTHKKGSTTLDGASYTVDLAGNRQSRTPLPGGTTSNFTYDAIYELLTAKQGSTTKESYTYDPVGNRLSNLSGSGWTNNSSNELTARPGVTYTYDNNGNTQTMVNTSGTTTYNWDYENRLTSVTLPGSGGTVSFKYDQFGRRVYKSSSSGTSVYVYDLDNLIEETDASGGAVARYSQGLRIDEPLAMLRSSTTSYYQADGLGSITSLSNVAGSLANSYTYDSFGKLTTSTGSINNPFRFTSREFDTETNLQFSRARYYDPQVGRFIGEDPVGFRGGQNFYAYVENSVTNLTDPLGLWPWSNPGPPPTPAPPKPPPIFYPPLWNTPGFVNRNNCYSYACDRLHAPGPGPHAPQPGEGFGISLPPGATCAMIMAAAGMDGLKNSPDGTCPCNTHRVVLFTGQHVHRPGVNEDLGPDYHWYRQDVNGLWSSKHGLTLVGPQVGDYNADARSWGYDQWCGSMCAPNQ